MILRDFRLNLRLPKNEIAIEQMISTGLSRTEAIKKEYEENGKETSFKFRLESRCITSMYGRLFHPIKAEFWRLWIECVPENELKDKIIAYGGVCELQTPFNYDTYCLLTPFQKKVKTLDLLYAGIERVSDKYNWDIAPFRTVREEIIESNYTNHWFRGKAKKSPDRKHSAQVYLEHEPEAIYIYLVINDREGTSKKNFLVSEIPDELKYVELLGGLKWDGNKRVSLISRQKDKSFSVDVE
jgi:hypothetical protein